MRLPSGDHTPPPFPDGPFVKRLRTPLSRSIQQVVNAFPWNTAPRFLIRDRDRAYGLVFSARLRGLGIREIRTAVRAPRMNAFAERVIGTLRRECFDHLIVLNQRHAKRLL